MMEEKTVLDYLVAIGSIATPILILLLTGVGWKLRTSMERKLELENKLRDDRIATYNQILEPFIIHLTTDKAWQADKKYRNVNKEQFAASKILSFDYKLLSFRLALIAPDSVVKAYNNLMQHFYNQDIVDVGATTELLGKFLIEIRKSMGNESTKLDHWDMCEFWLTDARKLKK